MLGYRAFKYVAINTLILISVLSADIEWISFFTDVRISGYKIYRHHHSNICPVSCTVSQLRQTHCRYNFLNLARKLCCGTHVFVFLYRTDFILFNTFEYFSFRLIVNRITFTNNKLHSIYFILISIAWILTIGIIIHFWFYIIHFLLLTCLVNGS